jgi:Cu/Ag efflux protein CusF
MMLAIAICVACSSSQPVRKYKLEGKVTAIDKPHHLVTVDEKAIPDYMEAMEMTYSVPDDAALNQLKTGDEIAATLNVSADRSWLESPHTITSPAQ